ncbi:MAG: hypothetical protein K2M69_08330 [Muribaculaceae bacterium]|nr:hypothetical protein [Muribaculaceae bacterium]
MRKIKDFIYRRKVRKLAERILANQPVMSHLDNMEDMAVNSICTAKLFYYKWNGEKIR